jgi:GT2 family glycosyltransferase
MTAPLAASVVIPTHRRPDLLSQVVEALGRQDVGPGTFEVIVVCDGLDDPAIAAMQHRDDRLFSIRTVEQSRSGPAAARNHGVRLAQSELIVFLDDDVVPCPQLVRTHIDAHGMVPNLVAVGPLLPPPGFGPPWIGFERRTLVDQYSAMDAGRWQMTYRQFYTGNASVQKAQLLAAGGFDETYTRAEDIELASRLADRGSVFRVLPEARVDHLARRSYRSWLDIGYRYGRADVRMARDKQRPGVLETAGREFQTRHPVTRALVRLSLRLPATERLMAAAAHPLSLGLTGLGLDAAADRLLASAFNLAYWRGVSDELGGSAGAREVILRGAPSARRPSEPGGDVPGGPALADPAAIQPGATHE